jgi:hypothetical protein
MIQIFDSNGVFVRTFGREGQGPNEYRWIVDIEVGPSDSISLFDSFNLRRTVLSPDLEYVRDHPLVARPFSNGGWILEDGSVVVNGVRSDFGHFGMAFHQMDPDGEPNGSFAQYNGLITPATALDLLWRPFTVLPNGNIVATVRSTYVLDEFDLVTGEPTTHWTPPESWFVEYPGELHYVHEDKPPQSLMFGVANDSTGVVWTMALVADDDWRSHQRRAEGPDGTNWVYEGATEFFDSMVEAVDWRSGEVLARRQFDFAAVRLLDSRHIVALTELETGAYRIDVWRLSFTED